MSAKLAFATNNDYTQWKGRKKDGKPWDAQGICTVASLAWAKKSLEKGRGLKTFQELGLDDLTMNAQMAVLRKFDKKPAEQTDMAGLEIIGNDQTIKSIDDVVQLVKATAPHVAIFWTKDHTMGYRYAHNEKEFFDIEKGLFRADDTKDIKAKMTEIIGGYGPVIGLRHVKLKS
jgi:hypothetical protein